LCALRSPLRSFFFYKPPLPSPLCGVKKGLSLCKEWVCGAVYTVAVYTASEGGGGPARHAEEFIIYKLIEV